MKWLSVHLTMTINIKSYFMSHLIIPIELLAKDFVAVWCERGRIICILITWLNVSLSMVSSPRCSFYFIYSYFFQVNSMDLIQRLFLARFYGNRWRWTETNRTLWFMSMRYQKCCFCCCCFFALKFYSWFGFQYAWFKTNEIHSRKSTEWVTTAEKRKTQAFKVILKTPM